MDAATDEKFIQLETLQEFIRQIGNQSALLAGFAFVGLISFSANHGSYEHLQLAFVTCSSIVIALELLVLFVTGILIFAIRLKSRDDEWWYSFGSLAWFLHLAGLVGFLVSLSMFVWIKWTIVAIPVVIICIAACAAMIANLYFISRQFLD